MIIHITDSTPYVPPESHPQDIEFNRDGTIVFLNYDLDYDRSMIEFGEEPSPKIKLYNDIVVDILAPLGFLVDRHYLLEKEGFNFIIDSLEHLLGHVAILNVGIEPWYLKQTARLRHIVNKSTGKPLAREVMIHDTDVLFFSEVVPMVTKKALEIDSTRDFWRRRVEGLLSKIDDLYKHIEWQMLRAPTSYRQPLTSMCYVTEDIAGGYRIIHPDGPGLDIDFEKEKLWQLNRYIDYCEGKP